MKKVISIYLIISVFLLVHHVFAASKEKLSEFTPDPASMQGWQWDFEPEFYNPENLFEYINGEAELYNDYKFVNMVTASYAQKENESITFTIDVYDMGTPLHAFGIYSSFRRPDLNFAQIGDEAIMSDLNIRFYKDKYFVQLNAGSTENIVKETITDIAGKIADNIPGTPLIKELALLPSENQVPHSLKYITNGFMGQSAFEQSFQAEYKNDSGQYVGYLVIFDNKEKAIEGMNAFKANVEKRGMLKKAEKESNSTKLYIEDQFKGKIIASLYSHYIIGVSGYTNQADADTFMQNLQSRL